MTYIEILEEVLTDFKREEIEIFNTQYFICNEFSYFVRCNISGFHSFSTKQLIRDEYPQLEKWITKIGKHYKQTFVFGDAWSIYVDSAYEHVPISEKIEHLEEYIKELKS